MNWKMFLMNLLCIDQRVFWVFYHLSQVSSGGGGVKVIEYKPTDVINQSENLIQANLAV